METYIKGNRDALSKHPCYKMVDPPQINLNQTNCNYNGECCGKVSEAKNKNILMTKGKITILIQSLASFAEEAKAPEVSSKKVIFL